MTVFFKKGYPPAGALFLTSKTQKGSNVSVFPSTPCSFAALDLFPYFQFYGLGNERALNERKTQLMDDEM